MSSLLLAAVWILSAAAASADRMYGHYMIRTIEPTPAGLDMAAACDLLLRKQIFLCHYWWRDGAGGKASIGIKDADIVSRVSDALGYRFVHARDDYLVNSVGIYSGRVHNGTAGYGFTGRRRMLDMSMTGVQPNAPLALRYLNARYSDDAYRFQSTGKNVTVFLVDGAVQEDHPELAGKIKDSFLSFSANLTNKATCAREHGTHAASLIVGKTYGVAKDANLVSVATTAGCGADSRTSEMLAGLDWISERIDKTPGRSVVVVSMQVPDGSASAIVAQALRSIMDAGAVVIAAAGDAADTACKYTPGSMDDVVTVGGVHMKGHSLGEPSESTNYGECVTVWAPGAFVQAASADPSAASVFTGTSVAAAIVAGVAAQILELNANATVSEVRNLLIRSSSNSVMEWTTPETQPFFVQTPLPDTCG